MGRVDALDDERRCAVPSSPISKRSSLPVVTLEVKIPALDMRNQHLGREPSEIEQSCNFDLGSVGIRLRPVEVISCNKNRSRHGCGKPSNKCALPRNTRAIDADPGCHP